MPGACILHRVIERLLHDAIKVSFRLGRKPLLIQAAGVKLRLDARMIRPLAYEGAHRFRQTDVVQGGRSEFPREEIHVSVNPFCNFFRMFQFLA